MSLTVPSNPLAPQAAAPAGAAVKWLWVAIGVLGVSVLALGATLLVQGRDATPAAVATLPADAAALPEGAAPHLQSNLAPTQGVPAQAAIHNGANRSANAPARQSAAVPPSAGSGQRVVAQAPMCLSCGRVVSVQSVQQAAPATGVGAVAGGVLGGVLGNQVGKGSGRTAATVLGAVGGGYLGHTVEQRTRTTTAYQMRVRMDDGSVRTFTRAQPVAEGTPVRVDGGTFRVDSSAQGPAYDAPSVRVADRAY